MSMRSAVVLAAAGVVLVASGVFGWRALVRVDDTSSAEPAARLRRELRQTPAAAHQQVFARYLETLGAAGVLDVLEKENQFCHGQAHPLGMAVFEAVHDLQAAIETCGNRCTGGCFHGVLTAAVKAFAASTGERPDTPATFEQVVAHARQICDDSRTTAVQRKGNCAHGIGHALTFLSGYRMTQAIAACRQTFTGQPLQYYCASGAYMERDMARGQADASGTSLLAPCDTEPEFPAACYRYKMPYVFRRGRTLNQVADLCLSLSGYQRLGCFHGLGFAQLENVSRFPETLGVVCRFGQRDDQLMCIEGAVEKLADFNRAKGEAACARLRPELAESCRQAIQHGLYALDRPFDRYVAAGR